MERLGLSQSVSGRRATPRRGNFGDGRGFRRFCLERECIGIEPSQNTIRKPRSETEAAQKAAHSHPDPDLAALIDAWPNLPEAMKAGILAMIRATEV